MDFNKINNEVDNFDIDNIDIADVQLDDIEIKKIKKNMNRSYRNYKVKKSGIAAAILGTIVVGGLTPAIAEDIPFIRDIYYELGIFKKEHNEYVNFIGKKQTSYIGETTIENIIVTKNRLVVNMIVKSEKPVDYNIERLKVYLGEDTEWKGATSPETTAKKIDDKTIALTGEIEFIGEPLKVNQNLFVDLVVNSAGPTVKVASFEIENEFKKALEKNEFIPVDKKLGNYIIKSLDVNILGTTVTTEIPVSEEEGNYAYDIKLKFDEEIYTVDHSVGTYYNDKLIRKIHFDEKNIDQIKNAKSIELICGDESLKIK